MAGNARQRVGKFLLVGLVALLSIIILHQPYWSLQNLLIGTSAFTVPGMVFMKTSVGFLTSLVVVAICKLVVRKPPYGFVVVAIITQVVWIEIEWRFSIGVKDAGELMIRF